MRVTRRILLQIPVMVAGPLAATSGQAARLLPAPDTRAPDLSEHAGTVTRLVDTLLPAEGASPAASELGVAERILAIAQRRGDYARLVRAGCDWLDESARAAHGAPFGELDEAARVQILAAAEAAGPRDVQGRFFLTVHRHALDLFYSHPGSWRALDYPGPPQPAGFPDHARAPGKSSA